MKQARLTPGEGFSPIHGLLYYTQRVIVPRGLRAACVGLLRRWVRARQGGTGAPSPAARAALSQLRRDGYAGLGNLLTPDQCAAVRAHMAGKPMVDRHEPAQRFTAAQVPPRTRIADFALQDILGCPHILELCNSPLLLDLAGAYIGCKPTISQLGMRWSFPCATGASNLQEFHRDSEDWHYFKVLVYLTDVGPSDGPHVFARGTHLERASLRLRRFSDAEVRARYGARSLIAATGTGGFAFAVDTAGIHKGQGPTGRPRLMLQIQYSLCPSYAYRYEPQPCAGGRGFDPYINRLLIRPA